MSPAPSIPTGLTVRRFCYAPWGTYGQATFPDGTIALTTEQPWADNAPGRSCIPEGRYECRPDYYHAGGYACIGIYGDLLNGRSRILIHKANAPSQLKGCIAVGRSQSFHLGQWAIGPSGPVFDDLMRQLGNRMFVLDIVYEKYAR